MAATLRRCSFSCRQTNINLSSLVTCEHTNSATYLLPTWLSIDEAYGDWMVCMSCLLGVAMQLMILSIWLIVDEPANNGFPVYGGRVTMTPLCMGVGAIITCNVPDTISAKIQPSDHMSTPLVYLYDIIWCHMTSQFLITHCGDARRISGALYHLVAT